MEYKGSTYATGSAFLTKDEYAYHFAKEIGLEPLPVNSSDGDIIHGELILDTWGEGLDKLPYAEPVRESFKKFKKEMLAINVEKRSQELFNQPFSDFMKGYPEELKQWWDNFGPSNWGATSEATAAALAIETLQEMVEESHLHDRYTWPGGLGAITKKVAGTLQTKYPEPDADGRNDHGRGPRKTRSAGDLYAGRRVENGCCAKAVIDGDTQVHHTAHCRWIAGETKRSHAADSLHPLSRGEFDFRQTGFQSRL